MAGRDLPHAPPACGTKCKNKCCFAFFIIFLIGIGMIVLYALGLPP